MSEHIHQHTEHQEHNNDNKKLHIHSHRALIGFDKHGIPTIVAKADHSDKDDPNAFIRDYMNAVAEYKKTLV